MKQLGNILPSEIEMSKISPHTASPSVLIENKLPGMSPAAEDNRGEQHQRENDASQIDFAHYLLELTRKKDFILCHICSYFLAEEEDNDGSVALGMLAGHRVASGGHSSECGCTCGETALVLVSFTLNSASEMQGTPLLCQENPCL